MHYILDQVTLSMGKNTIKTVVVKGGKTYEDEIEWTYKKETRRRPDRE